MRVLILLMAILAITSVASADVVINEILPYPGSDWDLNGDVSGMGDEFIELYNTGEEDVDIGNYSLRDTVYKRRPGEYLFPEGTVIPAGGFIFVVSSESGVHLGNNGDILRLNDSSGAPVDEIGYEIAPGIDISLARIPDGGDWNVSSSPTPGEPNDQVALVRIISLSSGEMSLGLDDLPEICLEFGNSTGYLKMIPGVHNLKAVGDGPVSLDLGMETRTTVFVSDVSDPVTTEDAAEHPKAMTSWVRFVNLIPDSMVDVILPEGGKIWFDDDKTEVEEGGCLFENVAFQDVTEYVVAYSKSTPAEVRTSETGDVVIDEELELEDGTVYTLVVIEDPETSENILLFF